MCVPIVDAVQGTLEVLCWHNRLKWQFGLPIFKLYNARKNTHNWSFFFPGVEKYPTQKINLNLINRFILYIKIWAGSLQEFFTLRDVSSNRVPGWAGLCTEYFFLFFWKKKINLLHFHFLFMAIFFLNAFFAECFNRFWLIFSCPYWEGGWHVFRQFFYHLHLFALFYSSVSAIFPICSSLF